MRPMPFSMTATTPGGSFPVIGYPQAWTSGTAGPVSDHFSRSTDRGATFKRQKSYAVIDVANSNAQLS